MKKYFVVISLISMLCILTACGASRTSKQDETKETVVPSSDKEELTALIEKYFAAAQKGEVDKAFPNLSDEMSFFYKKKPKNYTIDDIYQYSTRTASQEEQWEKWLEEMLDDLGINLEDDIAEAQVHVIFEDGEETSIAPILQKENNSWKLIYIDDTWTFGYN